MDGAGPSARLVSTASLSDDLEYLALSHCWGGKKFITLRNSNLEDFERSLPLESHDFNKTFTEAITITRLLGYNYLWIDSLCIIQDTDNQGNNQDWADEIPRMGLIYRHAVVTLSSTGFAHGLDGMQSGSRSTILPPRFRTIEGGEWIVLSDDLLDIECPLQSRGWTLQESLLSPRTLHFTTTGLIWECCSLTAHEIWPKGLPEHSQFVTDFLYHGWEPDYWAGALRDWSSRKRLFGSPDQGIPRDRSEAERDGCVAHHDAALIKQWYAMVAKDFMSRDFTHDSDRLPALLGIASHVQRLTGSKYLAGHFEHQLLQSLLWSLRISDFQKVDASFMPSWSWVSARGARSVDTIIVPDDSLELFAKYLGSRPLEGPHEGNEPGSTQHYRLHVQGYIIRLGCTSGLSVTRRSMEFLSDGYGYYECALSFARATPSDSSPRQAELEIEIMPDQPFGLDDMFSGALKCDPEEWRVCCDPVESSVFLLPIGTGFQETIGRSLRGLLVQLLDKKSRIYRRIGTFRSIYNSFANDLTPEEFSAALFEKNKEETVWIS